MVCRARVSIHNVQRYRDIDTYREIERADRQADRQTDTVHSHKPG